MKNPFAMRKMKIYKFVYKDPGYSYGNSHTVLLAATDPVDAVEKFNKLCGNKLADIIEFVVVTPKCVESEEDKT